eukprot:gb/GECG01015829.1/.p1 GENE.gb/GECG01015829.1/~~gb/GECG01015829.1/.p1  ORF type:complete len:532 (+),score=79.10 gb/GECG01015829.1/:1-1596(+)
MNSSSTEGLHVAIGATFACDGLEEPLQKMHKITGLQVCPSWIPYGNVLSTLEHFGSESASGNETSEPETSGRKDQKSINLEDRGFSRNTNVILFRLEDIDSAHPEMTADLENRAQQAKQTLKKEKQRRVEEEMRRNRELKKKGKQTKKQGGDTGQTTEVAEEQTCVVLNDQEAADAANSHESYANYGTNLQEKAYRFLLRCSRFYKYSNARLVLICCPPSDEIMEDATLQRIYYEAELRLCSWLIQNGASFGIQNTFINAEKLKLRECESTENGDKVAWDSGTILCNVYLLPSMLLTNGHLLPPMSYKEYYCPMAAIAAHAPYSPFFLGVLAWVLYRFFHSLLYVQKKIVVVDCDNTLWGGTVGEHSLNELATRGKYQVLQKFLLKLREKGLVLALVSKNSEADVRKMFECREDSLTLSLDDVTAMRVNWDSKSANIEDLARSLDLGLESFVFLDDNPIEIAEVSAHCPSVSSLQLVQEWGTQKLEQCLRQVWIFDVPLATSTGSRTFEDSMRTEFYQYGVMLRKEARGYT